MSATSRTETVAALSKLTREMRGTILEMITAAASGHPGGSLSAIDFIATLFETRLKHDPKNPTWGDRDRFILSKGHAVPALYVTLAHRGYFDAKLLPTLRQLGSPLQGHPVNRFMAACEAPTGSLGQGLSVAQGIALAGKIDQKSYSTFCLMGDGEIQEGQVWEAAMSAAKFKLDNLVAIVDVNNLQLDGTLDEVLPIEPIDAKFRAFGFDVLTMDGHDMADVLTTLTKAQHARNGKPTVVLAHTVKGKGVSFMENQLDWHGKAPNDAQYQQAIAELQGAKA